MTKQIGMFAFTGMNSDMCDELMSKHSIYLTRDGRISLAGLNDGNIEYVARAICGDRWQEHHCVVIGRSESS